MMGTGLPLSLRPSATHPVYQSMEEPPYEAPGLDPKTSQVTKPLDVYSGFDLRLPERFSADDSVGGGGRHFALPQTQRHLGAEALVP